MIAAQVCFLAVRIAERNTRRVDIWDWRYSLNGDMAGYRKWAAFEVEAVNHALRGIPEDRVRFHICWGSWHGPHSGDVPFKDVVDLLLKVNAQGYSGEMGNVRHEHESMCGRRRSCRMASF